MKLDENSSNKVAMPKSWVELEVKDAVVNISITDRKIPQKLYLESGAFPVIDQGKNYVGGYTNDNSMLIDCELPVIIFGDHTKAVKRANQRFAAGADGIKVLKPLPFLEQGFAFYTLLNAAARLKSKGYARHFQEFSKLKIKIPPLPEQIRIVAKIEELFSELDKGVENLHTAKQQLKVYRQALLKHAFEGKLTGATESSTWKTLPLGTLLEFLTSGSRGWANYYADEGDIFIRAQNIKHDWLDLSDIAFVSLPERAEGLRTRVRKGDLLITITGANVTKSALVETDPGTAYVSQHVALCRPTEAILPKYLYWFVIAETAGRKQLNDMAYGAGKPGLNLENIRSVIVPLPELQQQEEVVELIEDKLSVIDQLENTITTSLQQAEALRQSILKKAFSGQLVPQNPEDEPASVLLERIRAEREAQPVAKRPRKPTATAASTPEVVTEVKA